MGFSRHDSMRAAGAAFRFLVCSPAFCFLAWGILSFETAPAGNLWGWILAAHEIVGQDVPQEGHWFLPQYDMPKSLEHGSTHPLAGEKNS